MSAAPTSTRRRVVGFAAFSAMSILVTGMIWNTLQNSFASGSVREYSALFDDISGLQTKDHVRIAGVRVGKVEAVELVGTQAKVTFSVTKDQSVYDSTTVAVRYQNLIGQRYLALERPAEGGAQLQPPGQVIPRDRTTDSLDLSRLLNGFQPLFNLLQPEDVNRLSSSLIKAFEGQGPAMDAALEDIVALSSTIAERDELFGSIVDNLTPVLTLFARSGQQYDALLTQSHRLVSGLNKERTSIAAAVDGVSSLVQAVDGFVRDARVPGHHAVLALNAAMKVFGPQAALLHDTLVRLPGFLEGLARVAEQGNWVGLYPCHLDGNIPAMFPDSPISDLGGHHHTEVCR